MRGREPVEGLDDRPDIVESTTGIGVDRRADPGTLGAEHAALRTDQVDQQLQSAFGIQHGVTQRFPGLNVGFLEGGVAWAMILLNDIVEHFEKRNVDTLLANLDPATLDIDLLARLFDAHGNAYLTGERVRANPHHRAAQPGRPDPFDEFADSGMKEIRDLRRLFCDNFYFGCEADDRMTSVAFNRRLSPVGAKLKAMFGSDIGHWDVMEARTVLSEAWSLVEGQLLSQDDFRELTFVNPAMMHLGMNPHYFKGTAIEAQAAGLVAKGARTTA